MDEYIDQTITAQQHKTTPQQKILFSSPCKSDIAASINLIIKTHRNEKIHRYSANRNRFQ